MIHIIAIFLIFSQMSFSEWGGWGLEYHKDMQQCQQAVWPGEALHWRNLGPERHCFHEVRVSRVCLLVDILKTVSLPVAGNILCFLFTGSESSSKYLVPAASYLLIETKEVLKFNW